MASTCDIVLGQTVNSAVWKRMQRLLICCAIGLGLLAGTFTPTTVSAHYYYYSITTVTTTIIIAGGGMATATVAGGGSNT